LSQSVCAHLVYNGADTDTISSTELLINHQTTAYDTQI